MNEEDIALKAALIEPSEALTFWNQLMFTKKFDEINNQTIRVLPAIYNNLKNLTGVLEMDRLRGAYRVAWIKNTTYISSLIPILRKLEMKQIDYRILKGTALNFLFNSLGVRTMGDMDLIFRQADLKQVSEILIDQGFKQLYSSSCQHKGNSPMVVDSSWINQDGVEIDVHVLEHSSGHGSKSFFQKVMSVPPRKIAVSGTVAAVPAPELMLIHAVEHGNKKVEISDQIQSLLDCSRLMRIVDNELLNAYCIEENRVDEVQEHLNHIYNILGSPCPTNLKKKDNTLKIPNKVLKSIMLNLGQIGRLWNTLHSRYLPLQDMIKIWRIDNLNYFTYVVWITLFQLRPLERFWIKNFNGFVSKVRVIPTQLASSYDFVEIVDSDHLHKAPLAGVSQEWRAKLNPGESNYRIKVLLKSDVLITKSFLVFCNGYLKGVAGRNPDGRFEFELNQSGAVEISLRSPVRACAECKPNFQDLNVYIRKI